MPNRTRICSPVIGQPSAKPPGVVLIFVAGILTLMAALGVAFFSFVQMGVTSAIRYDDAVRAELLAQAGVNEAIARLRADTFDNTENPTAPWYTTDWMHGAATHISYRDGSKSYSRAMGSSIGENSDRFILDVEDAASRINVNACDNLAVVLDNLCRVIGPPLVPAHEELLLQRVWFSVSKDTLTPFGTNTEDTKDRHDLCFSLDPQGRPVQCNQAPFSSMVSALGKPTNGAAAFGDGYAIAGYRGRFGPFSHVDEVKNALTFVDRNDNGKLDDPLEVLEVEAKFAALRPYLTVDSWVDTNTVCVGKLEWVRDEYENGREYSYAIDRDKSWVEDRGVDVDPLNQRGTLRGCWLSIMNGHGGGQLRRIVDNGIDWVKVTPKFVVPPGPTSSYMVIPADDALLVDVDGNDLPYRYPSNPPPDDILVFPKTLPNGTLYDNPLISYDLHPLCFHRAPVNINTASDKVLAALFLGINVQQGHSLSVATQVDKNKLVPFPLPATWNATDTWWKVADPKKMFGYLQTAKGLMRLPADPGYVAFDRNSPAGTDANLDYLKNHGTLPNAKVTEAHELAYRIIMARQYDAALPSCDPLTGKPQAATGGLSRHPFRSWDDFFFRVVRPWDIVRLSDDPTFTKTPRATLIMAHFNANTDVLKFNPNIEWIDRWGRNFTEMEPVMIYAEPGSDYPATDLTLDCGPLWAYEIQYTPSNQGAGIVGVRLAKLAAYAAFDPTRTHSQTAITKGVTDPGGAYITRSYRYKSDELIDKTDLNRSTTELSFDSNGIFEIASTGMVQNPVTGNLLAERKLRSLVKVYDVWRESTQRQFVQGTFKTGPALAIAGAPSATGDLDGMGTPGTTHSGQVSRDASGLAGRKPLNTLPEPLVPLNFQVTPTVSGVQNLEVVDLDVSAQYGRNTWGKAKAYGQPDVLANRILPAAWDGQIILATNTSSFESGGGDQDTFLATFDGDLDTRFSLYNGREQAKSPASCKVRVVDTMSLLGAQVATATDDRIDQDPDLINLITNKHQATYKFTVQDAALGGLDPKQYWNNVTCRMGDLRTDGVYLSGPGVSGNDATLKYLVGEREADTQRNFHPDAPQGNLISFWFKSTWKHNDGRTHEFFSAANPAGWWDARQFTLAKYGRFFWATGDDNDGGYSEGRTRMNDWYFSYEGHAGGTAGWQYDRDCNASLHGGYDFVPTNLWHVESSSYRVQPFRWQFGGTRWRYDGNKLSCPSDNAGSGGGPLGRWLNGTVGTTNAANQHVLKHFDRPFIDTAHDPEGSSTWKADCFNTRLSLCSPRYFNLAYDLCSPSSPGADGVDIHDLKPWGGVRTGQDVKWDWADPKGVNNKKIFGINNLNYGADEKVTANMQNVNVYEIVNGTVVQSVKNVDVNLPWRQVWHYRQMPDDGTYAVIDELKISNKETILRPTPEWNNDRITRPGTGEMTLSRYYLPPNPGTRENCPVFLSQTLLQSVRGFSSLTSTEKVTLARVSWSVFTPRFMHEYKEPGHFTRREILRGLTSTSQLKGPFDYDQYNWDIIPDWASTGKYVDGVTSAPPFDPARGVDRPVPQNPPAQSPYTAGVEVELHDANGAIAGQHNTSGTFVATTFFTNPDAINRFGDALHPVKVSPAGLRYLVRFRYPINPIVDPNAAAYGGTVNPADHYLLDTPVFDDISVTYFGRSRILSYNAQSE